MESEYFLLAGHKPQNPVHLPTGALLVILYKDAVAQGILRARGSASAGRNNPEGAQRSPQAQRIGIKQQPLLELLRRTPLPQVLVQDLRRPHLQEVPGPVTRAQGRNPHLLLREVRPTVPAGHVRHRLLQPSRTAPTRFHQIGQGTGSH